jgi:hypothetical protein
MSISAAIVANDVILSAAKNPSLGARGTRGFFAAFRMTIADPPSDAGREGASHDDAGHEDTGRDEAGREGASCRDSFAPRFFAALLTVVTFASARAQTTTGGGREDAWSGGGSLIRMEGGTVIDEDAVKTAREVASHSTGTPEWTNPPGFEKDVFTLARVMFKSADLSGKFIRYGWGRGPRLGWWVDFPDADLNFSYRLQQLTSIRTNPDGKVIRLADPDLLDYPLLYMEHAGYINLRDDEVAALTRYLRNGGVLLLLDFWSQHDWEGFEAEMKKVLPDRSWVELDMDHPIFHCVYDIKGPMQKLQVPTIQFWNPDHKFEDPSSPPVQRVDRGEGSETMHVRALLDDHQRISVLAIHNSDIPDGWEREGENDAYFHTFSEKISYPLGINIVFYLMTH